MTDTRCLFRILSVAHNVDGDAVIKWAPTNGNRDGTECKENKSYFKWTPSGSGELVVRRKSQAFAHIGDGGWLGAGQYVYFDLYDEGDAPALDQDVHHLDHAPMRTEWDVRSWRSEYGQGVYVGLVTRTATKEEPETNNVFNAGSSWANGEIKMQVTNHHAFPAFTLPINEKGEIEVRRKTIDIRPA